MVSRPTKYAHVVGHLPRLDEVDPDRRALLNTVREEILAPPQPDDPRVDADTVVRMLDTLGQQVETILEVEKRSTAGQRQSAAFCRAYVEVRAVKDRVKAWLSSTQLLLDAYEGLMLQTMEAEGVASVRLASGASVSTSAEPYGKVVDKEVFRLWCLDNGYGNQLQLWPSTMNTIAKERTLAGEPPPDGVEVYAKTNVRLNKA